MMALESESSLWVLQQRDAARERDSGLFLVAENGMALEARDSRPPGLTEHDPSSTNNARSCLRGVVALRAWTPDKHSAN